MWLFDTSSLQAKMECGEWPIWLVVLAIVSDAVILITCSISAMLMTYFWYKRHKKIPHITIILDFVVLIILYAILRLMDGITYFWPYYHLTIFISVIAAIFSVKTLISLPRVIKYFLYCKSAGEYRELADSYKLQLEIEQSMSNDIDEIMGLMEIRIDRMEKEIRRKGWIDEQNLKLDELKEKLQTLKGKYVNGISNNSARPS